MPPPPALIGEIVAAEFLGDTCVEDLPAEGEGPFDVPTLTTVAPPTGLGPVWCTPAVLSLSRSGVVWFDPGPVGVPSPLPPVNNYFNAGRDFLHLQGINLIYKISFI